MEGRWKWQIATLEEDDDDVGCFYERRRYSAGEVEEETEQQPHLCGKGHRSSLLLPTIEGGRICLVCFANLVSDPASPSHQVSYALSQLSRAVCSDGNFHRELRACHGHLLVLPLVQLLSSSDEPIALQVIDLISELCSGTSDLANVPPTYSGESIVHDFTSRIADRLASGSLAWSRRQVFMLHCFGMLLSSPYVVGSSSYIRDKDALVSNLVTGLQLPSEEIRGEILFVLYKLSILQYPSSEVRDNEEGTVSMGFTMLRLSLEVLMKTQDDTVRMNCLALLTVLVQRGCLKNDQDTTDYGGEADQIMQIELMPEVPLVNLFADAVKGPLLSADTEVQIGAVQLLFHCLSFALFDAKQIVVLIEENISEYLFEILRLSGNKDPVIIPCLRVLDLLESADDTFFQRLSVGFPTLLSVLHYVADIPLHPVQSQAMKLVCSCISACPGVLSISQAEGLVKTLAQMFGRYGSGELGMVPETFTLACLTFVAVLRTPSSYQITKLEMYVRETSQNVISSSLSAHGYPDDLLLHSLYVLKEAFLCTYNEGSPRYCNPREPADYIMEICTNRLMPWLGIVLEQGGDDEDSPLAVLETLHFILLQESGPEAGKLAEVLVSSNWISWSFGFLGLFPSTRMRWRIFFMLGSVIDRIFGHEFGEPIRKAYSSLPSDPSEMMFLLGQQSSSEDNLVCSQSAVILILYVSSLFEDRIADERQVLASLEQYILVNGGNFSREVADSAMLTQLVHLYSFCRGSLTTSGTPYSREAEKVLFCLMSEQDWCLLSMGIHPTAFKWLCRQDNIRLPMSYQIRNFCRSYGTNECQVQHAKIVQMVDIRTIAGVVVSEDNYLASLLVVLLNQLYEDGQEDDAVAVMNMLLAIINIFPDASKQLLLNRITEVFRTLYYSPSSSRMFTACSLLAFNVLNLVHQQDLQEDGDWLPITVKLIEWLSPQLASDTCTPGMHLVVGILCLLLHQYSATNVLREASKAILLNTRLVSAMREEIQAACAKGPALANYDEETCIGKLLLLVLLLYVFSLRRLHVLLQETLEWRAFMQPSDGTRISQVMCITLHDVCRLLHYGSRLIKLVASQYLLELLSIISKQGNTICDELLFSGAYLRSITTVIEGLVFYGDITVATNCGLSLSIILSWGKLKPEDRNLAKLDSKWCRLIIEELMLYLAAPGLASQSFTNQHKPAAHIAVALLRTEEALGWLAAAFDTRSISGIIQNLSAKNISVEMVMLFRELAARAYLNKEQIAGLQKVFQARRKQMYTGDSDDQRKQGFSSDPIVTSDDTGEVRNLLIQLMLHSAEEFIDTHNEDGRLIKELDLFFQEHIEKQ